MRPRPRALHSKYPRNSANAQGSRLPCLPFPRPSPSSQLVMMRLKAVTKGRRCPNHLREMIKIMIMIILWLRRAVHSLVNSHNSCRTMDLRRPRQCALLPLIHLH